MAKDLGNSSFKYRLGGSIAIYFSQFTNFAGLYAFQENTIGMVISGLAAAAGFGGLANKKIASTLSKIGPYTTAAFAGAATYSAIPLFGGIESMIESPESIPDIIFQEDVLLSVGLTSTHLISAIGNGYLSKYDSKRRDYHINSG